MNVIQFPTRYVPNILSRRDNRSQLRMLLKSRNMYKKHKYFNRKRVPSYKSIKSKHLMHASKIYGIRNITPNRELSLKTGCTISALKKIVNKGAGAYYSSGSRPNQTPQSWGLARLASSITAGKAAAVDYDIIKNGCNHKGRAFILANQSRKKYKYGHSSTVKSKLHL